MTAPSVSERLRELARNPKSWEVEGTVFWAKLEALATEIEEIAARVRPPEMIEGWQWPCKFCGCDPHRIADALAPRKEGT